MSRTWGAVRRPRTVAVLAVVLALGSVAQSPAGARVASHGARATAASAPATPPPSPSPAVVVRSAQPPATPASRAPGDVSSVPGGRVLYLTFDDGPDPHWTPKVLALLARYHATATFFQVGEQVRAHRHTAAAVRAAGQRVGNHTSHHRGLTGLSAAQVRAEIRGGVPGATCLRPPYGYVDRRVRAVAAAEGQRVVLWSVDTEDWARPGAARIEHHLLFDVKPGRIVLMHDGGGNRQETLTALAAALPVLAARGYRFAGLPGC